MPGFLLYYQVHYNRRFLLSWQVNTSQSWSNEVSFDLPSASQPSCEDCDIEKRPQPLNDIRYQTWAPNNKLAYSYTADSSWMPPTSTTSPWRRSLGRFSKAISTGGSL